MIDEEFEIISEQNIINNLKQSEVIVIDIYPKENNGDQFFIICFSNTIIILKKSFISSITNLFTFMSNYSIYFLSDIQKILNEHVECHNFQIENNKILLEEICEFKKSIIIKNKETKPLICHMIPSILSCIIGYLIREGYSKANKTQIESFKIIQKTENFLLEEVQLKENYLDINRFIELRGIGVSTLSTIRIYYDIEKRQLVVMKSPNKIENDILINREKNNYLKINYPLLPRYIGYIKENNSLVIQFINGQTLSNIEKIHLDYDEKLCVIFQIMLIFEYIHDKGFVYRDLKPDNIIIDDNKIVFIIDFDRMINLDDEIENKKEHTHDFIHNYYAPEIDDNVISYKNDIYSIGQIIYYIINDKQQFENNSKISNIYQRCTNKEFKKRPSITELIFEFYLLFSSNLNESYIKQIPKIQYFQDLMKHKYKHIKNDINKSIYYLSIAANQNDLNSQLILGSVYLEGEYIERDINKVIYYFTLAANQNDRNAQHNLGVFYYGFKNFPRNINKSIYFHTLAANQNDADSQFYLGEIYSEGEVIARDINKAIHYLSLAANQNHLKAQNNLGKLYYDGQYVAQNINKAIYYFTLAAKQNDPKAQLNLGLIYLEDEYVTQDINKAIHYLSLAANQNHLNSQKKTWNDLL